MAGEAVDGEVDPTANPDMNPVFAGVCPLLAGSRQGSALVLRFTTFRRTNRPATRQNAAFSHRFPRKTLNPAAISRNLGKKPPIFRP
jgi:hypothetical protein